MLRAILTLFLAAGLLGCSASETTRTEERVHTGYGSETASDFTGAASTVDAEDVAQRTGAVHFADLLRGQVAGVQVGYAPGGGLKITIRGATSMYGSNRPLYVVDGMPVTPGVGGALSWLNPKDVASITVLKDAGATAIYGSRGANGVIVVETKQ
ncbi:TonB-dependent receptor plug domain-containing protein [Salisaeta longa]|uniref:TonB-dependent receptor plug domain-containing protein n=1 Tax=Salisaeta longa TaxID=503170 RepID=UPI000410956F|nr:TonB-dependent receptor plug domain-containing protein [Salisaeta longa]